MNIKLISFWGFYIGGVTVTAKLLFIFFLSEARSAGLNGVLAYEVHEVKMREEWSKAERRTSGPN